MPININTPADIAIDEQVLDKTQYVYKMSEKNPFIVLVQLKPTFKMHGNMLVLLKLYLLELLKVKLTHPDNTTGSLITLQVYSSNRFRLA